MRKKNTSDAVIGEYRLYRVDIWNRLTKKQVSVFYVFAPFLHCALTESLKRLRTEHNLYIRTVSPCIDNEAINVVNDIRDKIFVYQNSINHVSKQKKYVSE